jgi:hypothetical protein
MHDYWYSHRIFEITLTFGAPQMTYKLGYEWDERRNVVRFPAEADIYLLFSSRLSIAPQIDLSSFKWGKGSLILKLIIYLT